MSESGVIIPEVVWAGPGEDPNWRQASPCNQRCPYLSAHAHGHIPHHGGRSRGWSYDEAVPPIVQPECEGCPFQNSAQSDGSTARAPGSYGQLTDEINAWLASPSPLFGAPWELVLILGFGSWAVFKSRGGW